MASAPSKKYLYLGLMSGTSLNSIDCGLFDFSGTVETVATHEHPFPDDLREELQALCAPGNNEIHRLGVADRKLGELFAEAVQVLLKNSGCYSKNIIAAGSHGQTIRHQPLSHQGQPAYTIQIGDPNTIASRIGIPVVADFRRRDISLGGQGAPLAPVFHHHALRSDAEDRCIANIGGIANITLLARQGSVVGFDTGPGNVLMNTWINVHKGLDYDHNGAWAAVGKINQQLLERLFDDPWFKLTPPKSTGREKFNSNWLHNKLQGLKLCPEDVMATLTDFTALSIAIEVKSGFRDGCNLYLCGGGAHNGSLRRQIQFHLPDCEVHTTRKLGLAEDWVEAATFAWLAKRAIEGKLTDFSSITGSTMPYRCGAIYFP